MCERERGERMRLEGKVTELDAKVVSVTSELTARINALIGKVAKRDEEITRLKSQISKDNIPEGDVLYYEAASLTRNPVNLRYIPYFLWGDRTPDEPKEMMVWVRSASN